MNDEPDSPSSPFEDLQKQVQDLLRGGNFQFITPGSNRQKNPPAPESKSEKSGSGTDAIRQFDRKPREVKDYLDRFVIKQHEAKKVLSVAMCDHYNHVRRCLDNPELAKREYTKQNVILLGPTGVGKTYLMKNIARLIGVPFVKADATKFSETGYVGYDVDDIVRDLVKAADGDVELARYGIIYVDEVDKIASQMTQGTKDVSGRGVQTNLLKLMEDTDVNLMSQTDMMGQMQAVMDLQHGKERARTINTRHMLFIVSGAFMGMIEAIKQRVENKTIGFAGGDESPTDDSEYLKLAETRDFIDFGFEPEFIGRLPVRVACESLSAEDLRDILTTAEGNILQQYEADFQGYGIRLTFDDDALDCIAARAESEHTGARGLMTVLERILRDFKFHLPSSPVKELAVTRDLIEQPEQALQELLGQHLDEQQLLMRQDATDFAERFQQQHALTLDFTPTGLSRLLTESFDTGKTVRALCEQKFRDFQYGLKLVARNTGQARFAIDEDTVEDPDGTLNRWVLESYRQEAPDD